MVVEVEAATKPSRFADFWQGAESLAPATQNDTGTSNSAPNPCFFAPQRRALFHLSFGQMAPHLPL
jgi:hypothetical protein